MLHAILAYIHMHSYTNYHNYVNGDPLGFPLAAEFHFIFGLSILHKSRKVILLSSIRNEPFFSSYVGAPCCGFVHLEE